MPQSRPDAVTYEHIVEDIERLARDRVESGKLDENGAEIIVRCLADAIEGFFADD